MKTPQIPPLAGMTPLGLQSTDEMLMRRCLLNPLSFDQATLAQRKANSPLMAPKPQIPCDHGLFSDERDQLELANMPMFNDAIED